jgi:hypothetical protein
MKKILIKYLYILFIIALFSANSYAQKTGINLTAGATPNTTLDINGSVAYRGGAAINLSNGPNSDIVISDYSLFRLTGPTAAFSVTGFTNGGNGRLLTIVNATTQIMTITHQATSSANNQIQTNGSDITVAANGVVFFIYNTASNKWVLSGGQGFTNLAWNLTGNTGTSASTNFIGTNDPQDLVFKANDSEGFRLKNGGNLGIGTNNPQNKLDVEGGVAIGSTYSGTNSAPTNGLLVEGTVGIGTNNPQQKLHIAGTSATNTGNPSTQNVISPTVRIEGLNATNNSLASSEYPRPVAVDANGDIVLASNSYNVSFTQTAVNTISDTASSSGWYYYSRLFSTITGLNQTISIPTDGYYLVVYKCFFASGPNVTSNQSSAGQGSYRIVVDGVAHEESYISSTSVFITAPSSTYFYGLGQQGTITKVMKFTKGNHTILCQGRGWASLNADTVSFGINTSAYVGSGGASAAYCTLSVTSL